MDEGKPVRPAPFDLVDRALPGLEVELRRRARWHHERAASDSNARRVSCVQRAAGVEIRHVMPGMARCREAFETDDLVADHVDVLGRDWDELAPEPVERVAVEPAGARFEPRRVDHVRGSDLRDVNLQRRMLAYERARRAG